MQPHLPDPETLRTSFMKRSMSWLVLQERAVDYNDKNFSKNWGWFPGQYKQIYYNVLRDRTAAGERAKRQRISYAIAHDTEDPGNVEVVEYGGKGQTMRIVHP